MNQQLRYGNDRKGATTSDFNFVKPNQALAATIKQDEGIRVLTDDFKMLGFRKKPHEASCRQKQFELSKTACFHSDFNGNMQGKFFNSFNNAYDDHRSDVHRMNNSFGQVDSSKFKG